MTTNVSIWLRTFRPPLQRAYPRLEETDRDFAALLERADERRSASDGWDAPRPNAHDWNRTKR